MTVPVDTSYGYAGQINTVAWATYQALLGNAPCVVGNAWAATAVTTADRTIRLGAGTGFGFGVMDVANGTTDVQSPTVGSGTRWDTIVARRAWAGSGATTFVAVTGTSAQALPASLLASPGVNADQPLHLVRYVAGQLLPQEIIDLRKDVNGRVQTLLAKSLVGGMLVDIAPVVIGLPTGFTSFGGVPQYERVNERGLLQGGLHRSDGSAFGAAGGTQALFTLPPGMRPRYPRRFPVVANFGSANPAPSTGLVTVDSDGTVSYTGTGVTVSVHLDGINFDVEA